MTLPFDLDSLTSLGQHRMDCPSCGGINTLSVTLEDTQGFTEVLYNCFKAGCSVAGGTYDVGKKKLKTKNAYRKVKPLWGTTVPISESPEALTHLEKKFPFYAKNFPRWWRWHEARKSIAVPLSGISTNDGTFKDSSCQTIRNTDKGASSPEDIRLRLFKSLNVHAESAHFYRCIDGSSLKNYIQLSEPLDGFMYLPTMRHTDSEEKRTVYITEDVFSAEAIAQVGREACGIMGTSFRSVHGDFLQLMGFNHVVLALDKDTWEQRNPKLYNPNLEAVKEHGWKFKYGMDVLVLPNDPKYLELELLSDYLTGGLNG